MNPETSKPGDIFRLIPLISKAVGAIAKDKRNAQQNYSFRGIDDAYNALHGPLAEHGLFFVPEVLERTVTERATKNGGVLFYTVLRVRFTFFAPDGSSVQAVTVGEAMDSGDKSSNKAQSAATKYALLQVFCIPTELDDADAQTHDPKAQAPVKELEQLIEQKGVSPEPVAGGCHPQVHRVGEEVQGGGMNGNESTIVLGSPVVGTNLLRRFRVAGRLRIEIEPIYLPPIPRPANPKLEVMIEAHRAGYTHVRVGERVCRVCPDRPVRPSRPAMRLTTDDRPGVIRRVGAALRLVKDRA